MRVISTRIRCCCASSVHSNAPFHTFRVFGNFIRGVNNTNYGKQSRCLVYRIARAHTHTRTTYDRICIYLNISECKFWTNWQSYRARITHNGSVNSIQKRNQVDEHASSKLEIYQKAMWMERCVGRTTNRIKNEKGKKFSAKMAATVAVRRMVGVRDTRFEQHDGWLYCVCMRDLRTIFSFAQIE